MIDLPKKQASPPPTECKDCEVKLVKENNYTYNGRVNPRCKKCYRTFHNNYNLERAKRLKEGRRF